MKATTKTIRTTHWAGLLTGLGLAVAAFVAFQIPASGQVLGADVTIMAAPTGELIIAPLAPTLAARGLRPGHIARGEMKVTNITGSQVDIRFRALPSSDVLDTSAVLTVKDRGQVILRGTLAKLRTWSRPALRLPIKAARSLLLSVALRTVKPHSGGDTGSTTRDETAGQAVDVSLEFDAISVR